MFVIVRMSGGMTEYLSLNKDIAVTGYAWTGNPELAFAVGRDSDAEDLIRYFRLTRVEVQKR